MTGCEDCLAALLDHDAFVLCSRLQGRTPIHLASACGHTAVLRTLLQAALSLNPLDTGGLQRMPPMHWASYTGVALGPLPGQLRWGWRGVRRADRTAWVALDLEVRMGCQEMGRTKERGHGVISLHYHSSPCPQDTKIVWSCYLNTARFHIWKETPSLLCTVQCKSLPPPQPHPRVCDVGIGQTVCFPMPLLLTLPSSPSINNQDSTTEMLLGALGAKIVNSRDAKGPVSGRRLWGDASAAPSFLSAQEKGAHLRFHSRPGPPHRTLFTLPSRTMSLGSGCCCSTKPRWTPQRPRAPRS